MRDANAPRKMCDHPLLAKYQVESLLDLISLPADKIDQSDIHMDGTSGAQLCSNPICGVGAKRGKTRIPNPASALAGGVQPTVIASAIPEGRQGRFNLCEKCRCERVSDCWQPKATLKKATLALAFQIVSGSVVHFSSDG